VKSHKQLTVSTIKIRLPGSHRRSATDVFNLVEGSLCTTNERAHVIAIYQRSRAGIYASEVDNLSVG
jgi:hypothetical protein